ncbi:MAG: DUF4230 domain-containing protein [Sandaracinaceae bacterium]
MTEPTQPPAPAPDPSPGQRRMGCLRLASLAVLLGVAAAVGGAVASWFLLPSAEPPPPEETVEVAPTASVVVAVRDLARLETASFHMERVVEMTSRQRRVFGLVEAEDEILLVAAGDVSAGIDLTELTEQDVEVDPSAGRATLYLPPPRVFWARLDNERTYVYERETDLLAQRQETLETQARQEAERTMREGAVEAGILERAEANALRTVETLVRSLGYDDVRVEVRREDRH